MKKTLISILSLSVFGWAIFSLFKIATTQAPDFSVLWYISKDFYKTGNPYLNPNIYTPSGYPPFTYLLYLPLTLIPFTFAQTIFVLFSFFSILASVWLSLELIFKKTNIYSFLLASSLVLAAFPIKFTLGMGQINSIVLFLLLLSFSQYLKGKQNLSGLALGVSMLLKPIFGFFILFFIIKRRWRLILNSVITILAGFLGSLIFYGPSLWFYWFTNILKPLMNFASREVYYNQGFVGFVSRLTGDIYVRKLAEWGILFLSAIPIVVFNKTKRDLLLFSLFIITLLLVDSLSWQHHFIWLIFPFVLITKYAMKIKKIWFWSLLIAAYLLVGWNFKNPSLFSDFPKVLILSNTFYGVALTYLLTLFCLRSQQPQGES